MNQQSAPLSILNSIFGYASFRPTQETVIDDLVAGSHALLVMPTAGGKSLCYQVPALARPGIGLVISPLVALMKDQVDALQLLGIRAGFLSSTQDATERNTVLRKLHLRDLDLLYITPERAVTERFLELGDEIQWSILAIDEAHCISQWGHEFRTEYRQIGVLRDRWPSVPCLAVTATADEQTRIDIAQQLGISRDNIHVSGFDRPNLKYEVHHKVNARKQLTRFIQSRHADDAGIVYCGTRKRTEQVADWLKTEGFDAHAYHAGLTPGVRSDVQNRFLRDEGVIVVATIAFGMGIDKPNVRFVAHLDLPQSLEAYYQESGRGGRDGAPADCWLAFGWQDVARVSQMIGELEDEAGNVVTHRLAQHRRLSRLVGWVESPVCRREGILSYFGETEKPTCGNCDNCENPPQTRDATVEAQKFLSCVVRMGENFGAGHVVDVLRGSENEKVARFRHGSLSTYGIGDDLSEGEWRSLGRQFLSSGLLRASGDYGILKITAPGREVLRGNQTVEVVVDRHEPVSKAKRKSGSAKTIPAELRVEDQPLFEALRELRMRLAREQDVPAYVVLHDRTLTEIAASRPGSIQALEGVHGIGAAKIEKYGELVLEEVRAHS